MAELIPKRFRSLFRKINLNYPGLENVNKNINSKNYIQAGYELLKHYGKYQLEDRLPAKPPDDVHLIDDLPEDLLNDIFSYFPNKFKQPRLSNGRLDWKWLGPNNDKEWAYYVNRHFFILTLVKAYRNTEPSERGKYAKKFNNLVQDWIISNPKVRLMSNLVTWRGMEAALRLLLTWSTGFYAFINDPKFSDATKFLMLISIHEQATYLKRWHAYMGNHLIMQMYGIATAACCWPEFKDSMGWAKFARKKLTVELLKRQVYPDGIQKECSSHVHMFTLIHLSPFMEIMKKLGIPVSKEYEKAIFNMWNYVANAMRPNGLLPLNNDCWLKDYRYLIHEQIKKYGREDWLYIITNGKEGIEPRIFNTDSEITTNSRYFPWGGQVVMRNNWSENAHWSFFDIGPSGISPTHLHRDKLHLSISVFGRDILVDSGSYHHIKDEWRNCYFNSSRGHNTILIDGMGQKAPERVRRKINTPQSGKFYSQDGKDIAIGVYNAGYAQDKLGVPVAYEEQLKGKITHTRKVVYSKDEHWIVYDKVQSDRPHEIRVLWHFHPDCKVELNEEDKSVMTVDENMGNLKIIPQVVNNQEINWKVDLIKGQTKPYIQGWYCSKYGVRQPAYCAEYSTKLDADSNSIEFSWFIAPLI